MKLPDIRGVYKLNYNLAHLTWLKVGGPADVLFKPKDQEDLVSFLQQNMGALPVAVIGAGSNLIIRDAGIDGVVIKLGAGFTDIKILPDGNLQVGAGCLNYNLAKFALMNNIKNLEFLVGIPGTIGGGVAMNAGSYGTEFKDIIHSVRVIDKLGNILDIKADDIVFSYRKNSLPNDLIFCSVQLRGELGNFEEVKLKMQNISALRESTQPIREKTGGSTFANPPNSKAWELIDAAGLRGHKIGGASMSHMHCNFMINDGTATAHDMETLGEFVRSKVKEQSSIELKWEIKRIGRNEKV